MKKLFLGLAVLALGSSLALADEVAHDHEAKHGGILVHNGHHHLELVAKGNTLELFVRHEDGKVEDVSGAKASATVLAGGKTEVVTLAPSGENGLKGTGGFDAGKGTTVVVNLTMPGHETEQIRFKID
ncbi:MULTISPECIES: hypothetical protein [Hyphomicrobium]|jgi:hypothetical protein|uniref:hypothetical protein n=1 Tax=Hyphomicrobium TaxID=81 RepID=UPI000364E4D6|nr:MULTISPECIES: hypothetical protein [Hyphomicrobium]WBT38403.1 hypothetical protein PE058_00585 [Hyphomicrobium sp. DMF-1]HML43286.1 hypothetical protein [Hyphomicrobium zavarzinii]